MNKLLISFLLVSVSLLSYAQDTLYVEGKMYLGTLGKVDSTAQTLEFSEYQSDRKFIVPFGVITREKPPRSTTEDFFVDLNLVAGAPPRTSWFRGASKFSYSPLVVGMDVMSTVLISQYRLPGNASIGAYLGYQWSEKYAVEATYRQGLDVPDQQTFDDFNETTDRQTLRSSVGANLLVFPIGQTKFAPFLGIHFRYNTGVYYHSDSYQTYGIDEETGIRNVYESSRSVFDRRTIDYSDVGVVLGYRFNVAKRINLEVRLPIYSSNGPSRMRSYSYFSNFESETYRLDFSWGNENDRQLQGQLKFYFIYRFGGTPRP